MKNFKLWNNIMGWVVFAAATLSYLMTMEPSTSLWDCSEFIATSYKLEVGHPPGAPLYMLLARVASLFATTPADVPMMINGMNCIASGLCIMFLFWTITHLVRRITHRPGEDMSLDKAMLIIGSGAIGAMAYAYTDTFWFSAVEGEVYALSSMFTALVVWLMLKWEENAESPTSMRWIILIAYLMGLSIGVHILNLLTIPALVMIWFFRRYTCQSKVRYALMMVAALAVSFLILGAINGLIIPYTVALGAAVDTFAVNSLGMPVNAGMILFVVAVFAALAAIIWFTHSRRYRILNGVAMAVMVILIGFGSYAAVAIRANANPPMNSNNPSNPHMLLSLLNRDQYGNRPLFYGPYYSARPLPIVATNEDVTSDDYYIPTGDFKSKSMMWLNPETGKYEERVIFDDYIYPDEANKLFPRLWWANRAAQYEAEWVKTLVDPTTKVSHPTKRVSDEAGNVWYEPTMGENIDYFLDYQLGDMFTRYFMWNFVGRQDDIQLATDGENGIYLHGGWLSGIDFIDELFTGPADNIPSEAANNPSRNTYFFLPLLLGLLGIIYQASSDWRNFTVVSLLFVMMGIALVVYFNTAPNEPRERDYVYAGAFYAFSIWIGLGAAAIGHLLMSFVGLIKRDSAPLARVAVVTGLLISASVPVVLATENWDDHDRSDRYYARDLGMNFLNTAPENAILLNYGDNDTFPIWYCQEVEGIRPDVRVMNTSYLGGEWYIDEMKLAANDADGIPFTIPATKYSFVNDYVIVADPMELLMGEGNTSMRENIRDIMYGKTYSIHMPDTGKLESFTFEELYSLYDEAASIFESYDSTEFYEYLAGIREVPDYRRQAFAEYQFALLILEELEYNDDFYVDLQAYNEYQRKSSKLYYAGIALKDAIRLFVHDGANPDPNAPAEERALLLVINDGMMHIVESDKEIPVEERSRDFEIMGRINPKVDSFIDGTASDYIIAADYYTIPVDKDAVIATGLVEESRMEDIEDYIAIGIDKEYLTKDYLMVLDLLANFEWQRPISFTQPFIMQDYGLTNFARFDGFCYTLVPIYTYTQSMSTVGYVDHRRLYPLYMGESVEGSIHRPLQFGNIAQEGVLCDYFTRFNISATRIRENFVRVATPFIEDGKRNWGKFRTESSPQRALEYANLAIEDYDKASALLDRCLEVMPSAQVGYTYENTFPIIHAYYTIAAARLTLAIEEYEEAIDYLNSILGIERVAATAYDDLEYLENNIIVYNELIATARQRGIDPAQTPLYALALEHGENAAMLYAQHGESFMRGDVLAAEFVKCRGEWAKYYLQFGNLENFSVVINRELNLAMMDIIDVLAETSSIAGSYKWIANPTAESALVDNPVQFDALAKNYVDMVASLTPTSASDPQFALMESHIFNVYSIYYQFDMTALPDYSGPEPAYHKAIVSFLNRPEIKRLIAEKANRYGLEAIEVI